MTNRRRTLLGIGVAIAVAMAVIYAISATIVLRGFVALEERTAHENLKRVTDAYAEMVEGLDYITADWAGWDDTYTFIQGKNDAYLADNVVDGTLAGLRLNLILYVRPSGEIAFGTGFDFRESRRGPIPAGILEHLRPGNILLTHPSTESRAAGIVLVSDAPMLVVARPILTSDRKGPIRGTLIFGRYFDPDEVGRLAQLTNFRLTVHRFDGESLPADILAFRSAVLDRSTTRVQPLDDGVIAGYAVLRDIYNRPALILRMVMPRSIVGQGRTTMGYFLLGLVAVGGLLGGATLWLVDRLILSRLARRQTEERFRELFENANDIVFTADLDRRVTSLNRAGERLTGYTREEMVGRDVATIIAPEHMDTVRRMLAAKLDGAGTTTYELDVLCKDGRRATIEASTRLTLVNGRPAGVQGIARDITERKQAEAALRESEERYALAAQGANDGLWDWDLRTDTVYFSSRWKAMLGYTEAEVGTGPEEWFRRVHPGDAADLRMHVDAHVSGAAPALEFEYRMRHKDGSIRWMLCRGLAVRNGGSRAYRIAGSQTDITERKAAEQQLLHDAFHDGLSGLPNRALFSDRLSQAIRRAGRSAGFRFAVMFLDVDRFKLVNDSLGHSAGDELIKAIAHRLEGSLRASDTVARLGGDEFAVLVEEVAGADEAQQVADRIQQTLGAPYALGGQQVFTTVSVGIALSTPDVSRPEDYLRNADVAMYRAKAAGRARAVLFMPEMQSSTVALWQLETDLRRAIDRGEFVMHYQPIVALRSGRLAGFEALVRWHHPQRGLVSPAEFIPVAEETGLITAIGEWVLQAASRQAREWTHGFTDERRFVSVNLSGRQLAQPDLVERIKAALGEDEALRGAVRLEITESVLMDNVETAAATLARLRSLGLRLSVDDFGTGYSSLSALRRFPVNTLKIDRTFVRAMTSGGEDAEIVRAIVGLAHTLELDVVAEGVETEEQLAMLRDLQCEYAQGYLFSRPVDAAAATAMLKSRRTWEYARTAAATRAPSLVAG